MDLFATVAEVAGVQKSTDVEAVSFLPTLLGHPQPNPKRDLYFVRSEGGTAYGGKTIEALIRGDWKLIQDSPFQPLELYNLKTDPRETTNMANRETKIFQELSAALRLRVQQGGKSPGKNRDPSFSNEQSRMILSLMGRSYGTRTQEL